MSDTFTPSDDGTILQNASAYAAQQRDGAQGTIAQRRAAAKQQTAAQVAAKQATRAQRLADARAQTDAALAQRKAEADDSLQAAQAGQAKLPGKQQEFQALAQSKHQLLVAHHARVKLAHAREQLAADRPAYMFYGIATPVCQELVNLAIAKNMPMVCIDAYEKHGVTYYSMIFRGDPARWVEASFPVDADRAQWFVSSFPGTRNCLTDLTSFAADGKVVYAVSYVQDGNRDWTGYVDVPLDQTQGRFAALAAQGYGMMCQSYVQRPDGSVTSCGLFGRQQAVFTTFAQLVPADEYQRQLDAYAARRMLPSSLKVTPINGEPRFSVVWSPAEYEAYQARHHLAAEDLHAAHEQALAQGMLPVVVSGYSNGHKAHYAALWVRSPAPPQPTPQEPSTSPTDQPKGSGKRSGLGRRIRN
jgi:hypothetical protein